VSSSAEHLYYLPEFANHKLIYEGEEGMKSECPTCAKIVSLICLALVVGLLSANPAAADATAEKGVIVSGGSIGGTSNLSANALAAVIFKYCNVPTSIVANSTFGQVTALYNKETDIATAVGYQVIEAYNGTWKRKPYPDARVLFQCNQQVYHFITLKSAKINNFYDLKGKRVAVGKRGFFAEDVTKRVHKALGLKYGKFFKSVFLGHSDAAAALINGNIDAYVVMSYFPQPRLTEMAESHDCNIKGLGKEISEKVLSNDPNLNPVTIPATAYKGMDADVETVSAWMFYTTDKSLPEDVAYCATKSFFENIDYASVHYAVLKTYKLEDIEKFSTAPYHKGALRYFKEKGLNIPAAMIPPEAN
jgi:uncharacterized protein